MSKKMRPTAEFIGLADCVQTQIVARPTLLDLASRLTMEITVRTNHVKYQNAMNRWVRAILSCWLVMVVTGTGHAEVNGLADSYTSEFEKAPHVDFYYKEKFNQSAIARQEQFRTRVSIRDAVGDNVPLAFPQRTPVNDKAAAKQPSDSEEMILQRIVLVILCFPIGILALRLLAPALFSALVEKLSPWTFATPQTITSLTQQVREEDEAFSKFLPLFQSGPIASSNSNLERSNTKQVASDFTIEFCNRASQILAPQRRLLEEINRTLDDSERHRMLADLGRDLTSFKGEAGSPEFLPAWQMASALEGLLKQLSGKSGNVTRSTLRTVTGAMELLQELCKPAVRRDLLSDPPLRFLAADDDVISRTAVSLALKKAFNAPDLAENGETALGMAEKHAYDAIFLDVQMPGMDGFELCSKIHEIPLNKDTPVIFVTCMSDFDARSQSLLSGGSDLIGKPFLTFEITVKALTFALARRLQSDDKTIANRDVVANLATVSSASALKDESAATPIISRNASPSGPVGRSPELTSDTDQLCLTTRKLNTDSTNGSGDPPTGDLERAFLSRTSANLASLRDLVTNASEAVEEAARQEMLADLYLGLHALTPTTDCSNGHPAFCLITSLGGLVKKLLQDPKHWTSSAMLTIANALDLMDDLCATGVNAGFAASPPIQMLVVDDDPVSRRAMSCALQMTFGKPEVAENGEAALALAAQRSFDLIFMDVHMPGMDGFTACLRIRETKSNCNTPVVFVTGNADSKTRGQVATHGGNGLISKPFLKSEVTVKALTFAFQSRLQEFYHHDQCSNSATSNDDESIANVPQTVSQPFAVGKRVEVAASEDRITLPVGDSELEVIDGNKDLPTDKLGQTFLTNAATDIAGLRSLIPQTHETMDETARQDTLADLYVGLHQLSPKIDPAKGHPTLRLIAALEGLIKKLLEDPNRWTLSALLTIVNALDLMDELCSTHLDANFAVNPPIRILVAEDDPIACRAITNALRVTFGKPESVENGEAALAVATERPFDLIFMDVQMPDMDGFAACLGIRHTKVNGNTPVVFITMQVDSDIRAQVATHGGNGLISKPFLNSEVTLKALTFAFRSRLQEIHPHDRVANAAQAI